MLCVLTKFRAVLHELELRALELATHRVVAFARLRAREEDDFVGVFLCHGSCPFLRESELTQPS